MWNWHHYQTLSMKKKIGNTERKDGELNTWYTRKVTGMSMTN